MKVTQLIELSNAGCRRLFYQVNTVIRLACVMLCGKTISREHLATAKRELERNLRDVGISRSQAMRISGATLRYFKANT